jgi:hypothetical protein
MSVVVAFAAITIITLASSSNALAAPPYPPDCPGDNWIEGDTIILSIGLCTLTYQYWYRTATCVTPNRFDAYIEIIGDNGKCAEAFDADLYNAYQDAAMADLRIFVKPWEDSVTSMPDIPICPIYTEPICRFYQPTCIAPVIYYWDKETGNIQRTFFQCGTSDIPGYCYKTYKYCLENNALQNIVVDSGTISINCNTTFPHPVGGAPVECYPVCNAE